MALLALPTLLPLGACLAALGAPWSEHWGHLFGVVLPGVAGNTALLMLLVVLQAGLLGSGWAWLTARYDFPGRGLLHAALLLPLALPGYVLGFVAIHLLDYAGPVQSAWREAGGGPQPLWQIRSLYGAALILGLTLYPYVYLMAYNAYRSIGRNTLDMAATLGQTAVFRRIALPLAAPWIAGGLLLVAMEVLADFGTVALFNVQTFTTAIYKSWFGLFALDAALQLASVLVLLALALMAVQRAVQRRGRMVQRGPGLPRRQLRGAAALAASGGAAAFVLLVVGLPLGLLLRWSLAHLSVELDPRYLEWLARSLLLAGSAAALLTGSALLAAYLERRQPGRRTLQLGARAATLGYALPGTLLAVGLYAPLAALENALAGWITPGWVTQSLLLLLLGYWARFMAVAHTPISQQLARVTPSIDEAARTLGVRGWRLLHRVHRPLISGALASAAALLVIDVIKEMPITLMLRPSGFDTLATRIFELTAEGEYQRAALPALTIVLAGLVPVALLLRSGRGREERAEPTPVPLAGRPGTEALHAA